MQLTPHERSRLMIEAMARRDDREADRLVQTCPRFTYRCEDQEFRDRTRRIHLLTTYHRLGVAVPEAQVRLARAFVDGAALFAAPIERLAQVAFLYGRQYGKWEAGAIEQIELPAERALAAEIAEDEELREQIGELKEAVGEAMAASTKKFLLAVEETIGTEAATKRAGISQFCEQTLGVERATLMGALELETKVAMEPAVPPDQCAIVEREA